MPAPGLPFILCADDFGLSAGVSDGILELVVQRRISAVSCMMTQASIRGYAEMLEPHADVIDIGIHLVLTDMSALSGGGKLPSVGKLTRMAFLGRIDRTGIRQELDLQITAFADLMGRLPDFVDGHHHVHQLPGIGPIVLDVIERRFGQKRPFVRSCYTPPTWAIRQRVSPVKANLISLAGLRFLKQVKAKNLKTNNGFRGIYDLSGKVPYAQLFERFTDNLRPGTLIMCHPGRVDDELRSLDSLTGQRETELAYFAGEQFADLLSRKGLRLASFADALH